MVNILIDVVKEIFGIIELKKDIHDKTKLRISEVLNEVSSVLYDTAQKLKINEYPHGNCVIMERLSNDLGFHISEFVSSDDLDRLMISLKKSVELERLFSIREEPETIPTIEKAAGEFKSLSLIMRI